MITVSIVSHGHGDMVSELIERLSGFDEVEKIFLTRNILEPVRYNHSDKLVIFDNASPTGFAANHNAAFHHCCNPYFCVLNPDIELSENPFPHLLNCIANHQAALAAPLVFTPKLEVEDSFRYFPTPFSLLQKALKISDGRCYVKSGAKDFFPDWIAGMFMLFDSRVFKAIGGFDPAFYLYYEDVDICARLWKRGYTVVACPSVRIIHSAQRASHRKFRYALWHLASMSRYFIKHYGRVPKIRGGTL